MQRQRALEPGGLRSNVATFAPSASSRLRDGGADAAGGAGDERDPAEESIIVCHACQAYKSRRG